MSRRVSTAPLLLPLLLAVIAAVAGQTNVNVDSSALHEINDRVIASAFTGRNEVVCTYCLFQVVSAAYQIGNDQVRSEILEALKEDPAGLSKELLDEADRLPTLNGTLTGYFQRGAFERCPTLTKPKQCASIEKFRKSRGQSVNFRDRGTVNIINTAVERATGGKIRDLFTSLAPSTELVFASTLVFHDKWVSRLRTVKEKFFVAGESNPVLVPTLINEDHMPLLSLDPDVVGVSIPYQNPAVRLNCFMAKKDGADIRQLLYQEHYLALATNATEVLVQVRMPKIDIVSKKYTYLDLLQQLELNSMFRGGLGPRDNLKVDQLVHKAVIQMDEHGTSAAGAAGLAIVPTSLGPRPTVVRFNKQFVCSLVLEGLNQPLFTTYIVDPRSN